MMNKYDIVGGNILVIGDLHFSDKKDYGKHKNYLENYINTGSLKCGWIWLAHYTGSHNNALA